MKKIVFSGLVVVAAVAGAAVPPRVSNVTQRVTARNAIVLSYHVDQEAIVTVSFTVEGQAVDPAKYATLAGDVNKAVRAGDHQMTWWPRKEGFAERVLTNAQAKVTAWSLDCPPPVMAMSLTETDTVRFYPDIDHLPAGGLTNNTYPKFGSRTSRGGAETRSFLTGFT